MKDGYYLSTYTDVDTLSYLLDIRTRHDHNISLWRKKGNNIKLIHYWELERITRLKHHDRPFYDKLHAISFINKLLKEYNLSFNDMIEVWGTPALSTSNDYTSVDDYKDISYHSIAHLFSSIFMDSDYFYEDNIIGLALDAGPDHLLDLESRNKNFYAGCVLQKGKIKVFPACSPGPIWAFAKKKLKMNEGSLMALATASKSKLLNYSPELIRIYKLDQLAVANNWVDELIEIADKVISAKEGRPSPKINFLDNNFSIEENKLSIIAKEIQKMSIRLVENQIQDIIHQHNLDPKTCRLAISGGFGLNCPTNSYMMEEFGFKSFLGPPCMNDTGQSMGIALYAFHKKSNSKLKATIDSAYYGNKGHDLNTHFKGFSHFVESTSPIKISQVVADVLEAPIAWFNGRAEIGPRALGNRSILADPSSSSSKDLLNKIKQREWWRPVAPIVLEDRVHEVYESSDHSPYMLRTFVVDKRIKGKVQATAHTDNTARVQTISPKETTLYEIINHFYDQTGVPLLCNTSLNDKGEPIIDAIDEVLNFCLRKNIKICYINKVRVELKNHGVFEEKSYQRKPFDTNLTDKEKRDVLKKLNPHNIPRKMIEFYKVHAPYFLQSYKIKDKDGARKLFLGYNIYAKPLEKDTMHFHDFLY